ncbi:MAG: hypothetical protein D5R96_08165 [Methanocalculus sp. MSAO_Arc2]|uniref:hypothetical protein n=1 Tax=Methanocalculus sp. MSAO_Arc2 TaxID=2293855 RepID=UPI000FF0BBAE|nr:MAG: hypothetical protein D5R96_08165 [Methanocalculus sp. MSAO_Arc2]
MKKTISEIRKEGISALSKALGPVDMAPFIQSYESGSGDYTKERYEWLHDDTEALNQRLLEREKQRKKV